MRAFLRRQLSHRGIPGAALSFTRLIIAIALVGITATGVTLAVTDTVSRVGVMLSDRSVSDQTKLGANSTRTALARSAQLQRNLRNERESDLRVARARAAQQTTRHGRKVIDWVLPVRKYHLSARFGQNGDHWSSSHHGLDFAAPAGTPIRAVGAGRIIAAGWSDPAYGRRIKILHRNGTVTLYAHMSAFERTSGTVRAGDVIGYVGSSGNATGPHLHLEVRPDGGDLSSSIDPYTWLERRSLDP